MSTLAATRRVGRRIWPALRKEYFEAALAVAPLAAAGAGELVAAAWPGGLAEQADARTAEQAAAASTAKPRTGDLRCRAEVIIVSR